MKNKQNSGFTLLEAMITIAVLAILVGIATPSLQKFVQNSRLNSEAERVYRIINATRQEAVVSGTRAMVCKVGGQVNPDAPVCNSGNNTSWDSGFLSYRSNVDMIFPAGNARFGNHRINVGVFANVADTADLRKRQVIQSFDFKDNGVSLVSFAVDGAGSDHQQRVLVFSGDGTFLNAQRHGFSAFRIAICDSRGDDSGRYIEINSLGRVFLKNTSLTDVGCDGI